MKIINRIIASTIFVIVASHAAGQGVVFHSAEIEAGVKKHIGLVEGDNVTVEQLDTITTLNLSGLGLTDIQDVRMVPNLQTIDLSYNEIDDVSPLAQLEFLKEVNLSHNMLKSINMLTFTSSDEMIVDVGFNYISDFSCFNTLTSCVFIIKGAGLQKTIENNIFDVSYLYCNSIAEKASIMCRVEAKDGEHVWLRCQDTDVDVPTDNSLFTYEIVNAVNTTTPVFVTNGAQKDSTYYVPVVVKEEVKPLETVTIETGLPDEYIIKVLSPIQQGTVNVNGTTIEYVASDVFRKEDLLFVYSDDFTTKGISKIQLSSGIIDLVGDADGDGTVDVNDVTTAINHILDKPVARFILEAADVDGDGIIDVNDVQGIIDRALGKFGASAVDLGLPSGTLWASCNVGATKPEEFGDYYAWGETEPKESYELSNYSHCEGDNETCRSLDGNICGTQYDVAHVKWGGDWRMPTLDEIIELVDNCIIAVVELNSVQVMKFTGTNGNSIYLPFTGYVDGKERKSIGRDSGYYWSGVNPYTNQAAPCLVPSSKGNVSYNNLWNKYLGLPIRPVKNKITGQGTDTIGGNIR